MFVNNQDVFYDFMEHWKHVGNCSLHVLIRHYSGSIFPSIIFNKNVKNER